jgi:hypothetical protein
VAGVSGQKGKLGLASLMTQKAPSHHHDDMDQESI